MQVNLICMTLFLVVPKEKDGEVRSFFPKQRFLTVYFSFLSYFPESEHERYAHASAEALLLSCEAAYVQIEAPWAVFGWFHRCS